jgi:acyl-coenzyme A synthetase/AMP-(fatty) acid ligase
LFAGATLTIPESRDPFTICKAIEQHKVDVFPASPTILNLILISGACLKFDLSSIRVITYGTEPMPEGLLLKLNDAFPHKKFIQTFGTSETGIAQVSSKSSASTRIKFDDTQTKYKVVDGELLIKSSTMIIGYLNARMDQFTSDGWFKTGDLVETDKDGYLVISGRKNEIINVAGLKVYPQEVESVLMEHPIVLDCLVYGEKNLITGNVVLAKVKISEAVDRKFASDEIRSHLRNRLERYKVPLKIFFVDSIDHNKRFKKIRNF